MAEHYLLEYLMTFLEEGSLLKASRKLSISQPSLTKAMQNLERELGLKIFDRTANRIQLNENGKKLIPYMEDILEMDSRLSEKARELKENSETLSIGYIAPGIQYRYPEFFQANSNYSLVKSELKEEKGLLKGLKNNRYDIIFLSHPVKEDGFVCEKVLSEHLFISVPKTHFLSGMKDRVTWKDIDGQSFLLYNHTGYWEEILSRHLSRSRLLRNESHDDLEEMIENSTIPNFVTDVTGTEGLPKNRISLPIEDEEATLDFYAVVKKKNLSLLSGFRSI